MSLNGIDEAVYQSGINNSIIAGDFVIVKATQGISYINTAMDSQLKSAIKGNKLIGLYHFSNGGNYKAEANYFLRIAKPYLKKAILVLDYEGIAVTVGKVAWAKNFLDYVYQRTSIKPLLYMSLSDNNLYNWSSVAKKYSLWFAQYDTMNVQYGYIKNKKLIYGNVKYWSNKKIAMYQYSANGRLSGYNGALDLDLYYGKKSDWLGHSKNDTKEDDIEMTWHPRVMPLAHGAFCVTKKGKKTTVWNSPDVNTRKDTGLKLPYGSTYRTFDTQKAFIKVGKNQWVDSACGILKENKLFFDHKAHCTCVVVKQTRGYAKAGGKPTGRVLKVGEKYKTFGYKNGFLRIGAGNNTFVSEKFVRIIL